MGRIADCEDTSRSYNKNPIIHTEYKGRRRTKVSVYEVPHQILALGHVSGTVQSDSKCFLRRSERDVVLR